MASIVLKTREQCQELVRLERRIACQRKIISELKARKLPADAEQNDLALLLEELDRYLRD